MRPIPVVAQLEHCRELMRAEAPEPTLAKCFDHAGQLLSEGMRVRRSRLSKSPEYESQLTAGVAELRSRLAARSLVEGKRRDEELGEIERKIHTLRIRLSKIAATEGVRLSLISRGGVSLGNWQAGFLYLVTEWAKGRPGQRVGPEQSDPAFSIVTGASAGAVNGLAASIEGCRPPNLSASKSLYYKVWTELGLFGRGDRPGLFPSEGGRSTLLSLFTSEALDATLETARRHVETGEPLPGCSVDFGFVATHLHPTESPIHVRQDGTAILSTKKLKEKFALRLTVPRAPLTEQATGPKRLHIENIRPPESRAGDQIYFAGLGHEKTVSLQSLLLAVRASGAFPAAFPPVLLAYTQFVQGPGDTLLPRRRVATFIDGGILDNTPVGLAVTLDGWRRESDRPEPYLEGLVPDEPTTYLFLEPFVRSWVLGGEQGAGRPTKERNLLATYLAFAGDLLATTTDAQLSNTAERFPFVRRERDDWSEARLSVPERHMPITGARWEHFMAFLERDFRVFDFYVGMADALEYLEGETCLMASRQRNCGPSEALAALDAALMEANASYRCMRAYYDSESRNVPARITADELPEACQLPKLVVCDQADRESRAAPPGVTMDGSTNASENPCVEDAIASHNFRILLAAMHNYKVWMQSDQYTEAAEVDRFFDELSGDDRVDRFIYIDLPSHLGRSRGAMSSKESKQAFRLLVQQSIDLLAVEQPGLSGYALKLGGRAAADGLYGRDFPRHVLGVGVVQSGLELVYGRRIGDAAWRWDSALRVFNLRRQSFAADLEPFTSEFYVSTQASWIVPTRFIDFEIGAGWALSETVALSSGSPGHVVLRSGPRGSMGLVILQRAYLTLNADYYPLSNLGNAYRDLSVRVADDWEVNLAAGWRFLF